MLLLILDSLTFSVCMKQSEAAFTVTQTFNALKTLEMRNF